MGCALALGPAEGTRARGGWAGACGARVSGAHPQTGPRRSLTRSDRGDRSSADTGEPRRRERAARPSQRPASSRTTRKDFW